MLHRTKVLLNDASSQRLAGRWQAAIALCNEVYLTSIRERDTDDIVESVITVAHCYREMGDTEHAAEQYELAYTIAHLQQDYARASRALNGIGILRQEHGEMEQAELVYRGARDLAMEAGDVQGMGNIDQNLGTLANIRGDLSEALRCYQSSLKCYEEVHHERGIGGVLNNLGMLYIDLREYGAARDCLDRALRVCQKIDDVVTESIVHINRTELFVEQGELEKARVSCDEAYEIVSRLGEHSGKSEALKFYGVIYRESHKPYLAESHLREAILIASSHNYPLQEAEAQRELALVLREQDRNREALDALNRAHSLFSNLQAQHDQADINKRFAQLEGDFLTLVRMWGESIEAKDRYTRGHCQRVAEYACRIAERTGMSKRDLVWFRMGAFLHDVGKTEVPEAILNKPGKLTPDEREIMERHTIIGDEMLSSIEFPWDIRPMVRSHHERWDGKGYPDGLAGEAIPLTGRILRIADIFDALTTTRSYREPLTSAQAFNVMSNDEGGFDPNLFRIFEELFPEFTRMVDRDEQPSSASSTSVAATQ